jgi:hypothetical protein
MIHKSTTAQRVLAAVQAQTTSLDDPGFCLACGADAYGIGPDAYLYLCEACGERRVFGAEEILLMMAYRKE